MPNNSLERCSGRITAFTDIDCPLHDILQFADVAGPTIFAEKSNNLRRNLFYVFVQLSADRVEKVIDKQRDIALAVAERRHRDRETFNL